MKDIIKKLESTFADLDSYLDLYYETNYVVDKKTYVNCLLEREKAIEYTEKILKALISLDYILKDNESKYMLLKVDWLNIISLIIKS